jgi:hypothetical protein
MAPTAQGRKRSKRCPAPAAEANGERWRRVDHAMSPSRHAQPATEALRYARCATWSPWHRFVAQVPKELPAGNSGTIDLHRARVPANSVIHNGIWRCLTCHDGCCRKRVSSRGDRGWRAQTRARKTERGRFRGRSAAPLAHPDSSEAADSSGVGGPSVWTTVGGAERST